MCSSDLVAHVLAQRLVKRADLLVLVVKHGEDARALGLVLLLHQPQHLVQLGRVCQQAGLAAAVLLRATAGG